MMSFRPGYIDALRFTEPHVAALKAVAEFRGKQELFRRQTPEVLASLRDVAVIESSESSNRIEGVVAPHDRIEGIVLRNTAPKGRSEQEIAGYRDALNLIHESARQMAFSTNVILQLHQMLYRFAPGAGGRWKAAPNQIVERNPDGSLRRVRFTPVSPVATPGAMEDLVGLFGEALHAGREPLVAVPLAVLDFLCVHPFGDGNGRMARLLTLMLLYQHDYEVGRYISLERIFEQSKESYYETLEASSHGWHEGRHDPFPWLTYSWGVFLAAYREFEERVGTIRETGRGAKTALVEAAVARRISPFRLTDIEAECPNVSRDMVRYVLRRMQARGELTIQGKARAARYVRAPR